MLSSVFRSERAVQVNIEIMRAFVRMRRFTMIYDALARKITTMESKYDALLSDLARLAPGSRWTLHKRRPRSIPAGRAASRATWSSRASIAAGASRRRHSGARPETNVEMPYKRGRLTAIQVSVDIRVACADLTSFCLTERVVLALGLSVTLTILRVILKV
jgi:hypothetical protein